MDSSFWKIIQSRCLLFPHREEEFREYTKYISRLFYAKQYSAQAKVVLYDHSIRNQVGGGQNVLLTDYHKYQYIAEAILHVDGLEYGNTGGKKEKPPKRNGPQRSGE